MTKISWQDRKREQKRKEKRIERQFQQDNQLPPGEYITTFQSINTEGTNIYPTKRDLTHFSLKRKEDRRGG